MPSTLKTKVSCVPPASACACFRLGRVLLEDPHIAELSTERLGGFLRKRRARIQSRRTTSRVSGAATRASGRSCARATSGRADGLPAFVPSTPPP